MKEMIGQAERGSAKAPTPEEFDLHCDRMKQLYREGRYEELRDFITPLLMLPREVAAQLRVSTDTVVNKIKRRELRASNISTSGRASNRIQPVAVEEYLLKTEVAPQPALRVASRRKPQNDLPYSIFSSPEYHERT